MTKPIVTEPDESSFTLDDLVHRAGAATEREVLAYLGAAERNELIASGQRVATSRVSKDAARLYGRALAFLAKATPAQRELLPAITDDFLRVAIWAAKHGESVNAAEEELRAHAGSVHETQASGYTTLRKRALNRRNQLNAALKVIAGADVANQTAIEHAYGSVRIAKDITLSLTRQTALARKLLADHSEAAKMRRKGSIVTEHYLASVDALAAQIEHEGTKAESTIAQGSGSHGDVDYWDGVNIHFVKLTIEAFESGHADDASIPRLTPLALLGILARPHRAPKSADGAAPAPATP